MAKERIKKRFVFVPWDLFLNLSFLFDSIYLFFLVHVHDY